MGPFVKLEHHPHIDRTHCQCRVCRHHFWLTEREMATWIVCPHCVRWTTFKGTAEP